MIMADKYRLNRGMDDQLVSLSTRITKILYYNPPHRK
jgi:hypothetical protein